MEARVQSASAPELKPGSRIVDSEPCEECGRMRQRIEFADGTYQCDWPYCPHGFQVRQTGNNYTGKTLWTGSEVYGNKYGSDEWRSDVVASMLKDQLSPRQMVESLREDGLA